MGGSRELAVVGAQPGKQGILIIFSNGICNLYLHPILLKNYNFWLIICLEINTG